MSREHAYLKDLSILICSTSSPIDFKQAQTLFVLQQNALLVIPFGT